MRVRVGDVVRLGKRTYGRVQDVSDDGTLVTLWIGEDLYTIRGHDCGYAVITRLEEREWPDQGGNPDSVG